MMKMNRQVKEQMEKEEKGGMPEQGMQGVLYPLRKQFIQHTHTRTCTHSSSSSMLSISFLAVVAIMALCTNYSARSRKCVVGKSYTAHNTIDQDLSAPTPSPFRHTPVCLPCARASSSTPPPHGSAHGRVQLMCVREQARVWHK